MVMYHLLILIITELKLQLIQILTMMETLTRKRTYTKLLGINLLTLLVEQKSTFNLAAMYPIMIQIQGILVGSLFH